MTERILNTWVIIYSKSYLMDDEEQQSEAIDQIRSGVVQLLRRYDSESDLDKLTIVYATHIALLEFMEDEDVSFDPDVKL